MIFIRPLYKYDIEKLYEMKKNPLIFNKFFFNIDFSTVTKESINEWFYNFVNEINTIRLGKGYGYNSLKIIIDYCKNILKFKEIYLNVHTENLVAIKLYKKVNFEPISINDNYIYMKLNLL